MGQVKDSKSLYLIPHAYNNSGGILEYHVRKCGEDAPLPSYKDYEKSIVNETLFIRYIRDKEIKVKQERVIMKNSRQAYEFEKFLKEELNWAYEK